MKHTLLLEGHLKKKGCIDDANLVMEKSGMPPSHSSSVSGEAQEETSIDVGEALTTECGEAAKANFFCRSWQGGTG